VETSGLVGEAPSLYNDSVSTVYSLSNYRVVTCEFANIGYMTKLILAFLLQLFIPIQQNKKRSVDSQYCEKGMNFLKN
jgi:hypothetical protein